MGDAASSEARTPHIDALAREGVRFTSVSSFAPVCSPARSTLMSGIAASTTGAHHHRSAVARPAAVELLQDLLRRAGYFTFNGMSFAETQTGVVSDEGFMTKTDVNFDGPGEFDPDSGDPLPGWDEMSGIRPHGRATHWNRRGDRPFFGLVNFIISLRQNPAG